MKTLLIIWGTLCVVYASADSGPKRRSVRYGTFQINLDQEIFAYNSTIYDRKIPLNVCNRQLAETIFKRISPGEKVALPFRTKPTRDIVFENNGITVTTGYGSRTHTFLEGLPKAISSYVTLMKQPCP